MKFFFHSPTPLSFQFVLYIYGSGSVYIYVFSLSIYLSVGPWHFITTYTMYLFMRYHPLDGHKPLYSLRSPTPRNQFLSSVEKACFIGWQFLSFYIQPGLNLSDIYYIHTLTHIVTDLSIICLGDTLNLNVQNPTHNLILSYPSITCFFDSTFICIHFVLGTLNLLFHTSP